MPKSATRRRKQPQARTTRPAAREARPPLLPDAAPVEDGFDEDGWDGEGDGVTDRDDAAPAPSFSGRVRAETARRGQVPFLLHDVIKANHDVAVAERQLHKRVQKARTSGATWEDIGVAVGMTRQGAAKRFGSSAR
jgi:hypothetical protein